MSLEGRVKRLETGPRGERCEECGASQNGPTAARLKILEGGEGNWTLAGYAEPRLCGCGRVLGYTLKPGEGQVC